MEEAEIWPSRWAPRGRTVLRGVLGAGAAVGGGAIWAEQGAAAGGLACGDAVYRCASRGL